MLSILVLIDSSQLFECQNLFLSASIYISSCELSAHKRQEIDSLREPISSLTP